MQRDPFSSPLSEEDPRGQPPRKLGWSIYADPEAEGTTLVTQNEAFAPQEKELAQTALPPAGVFPEPMGFPEAAQTVAPEMPSAGFPEPFEAVSGVQTESAETSFAPPVVNDYAGSPPAPPAVNEKAYDPEPFRTLFFAPARESAPAVEEPKADSAEAEKSEDIYAEVPAAPPEEDFPQTFEENGKEAYGLISIFAVALIFLIGFSLYNLPSSSQGGGEESNTDQQQDSNEDANLVSAQTGGEVRFKDGNNYFVVSIPPGALARDEKIGIEKTANGVLTNLYHLQPDGLKFLKPVSVSVPYNPSAVQRYIKLQYRLSQNGQARYLTFIEDRNQRVLRAQVEEF